MAIVSENGLLSGKYSDWFVNDHMAGWFSVLGFYNPFGYHGIVFGDQDLVGGSMHRILVVEYIGNDLNDFYLYN